MTIARILPLAASLACLCTLAACSSTPEGEETYAVAETSSSLEEVGTFTITATVTHVDAASRKLTLRGPDGGITTCKAGPAVANFDRIQPGDTIVATVTEEFAVALSRGGQPLSAAAGSAVALSPIGAKPGAYVANVAQTTARVEKVDARGHRLTLRFVNGRSRTIKVGKDIDLGSVQVGDDLTVHMAESLAIAVE